MNEYLIKYSYIPSGLIRERYIKAKSEHEARELARKEILKEAGLEPCICGAIRL